MEIAADLGVVADRVLDEPVDQIAADAVHVAKVIARSEALPKLGKTLHITPVLGGVVAEVTGNAFQDRFLPLEVLLGEGGCPIEKLQQLGPIAGLRGTAGGIDQADQIAMIGVK